MGGESGHKFCQGFEQLGVGRRHFQYCMASSCFTCNLPSRSQGICRLSSLHFSHFHRFSLQGEEAYILLAAAQSAKGFYFAIERFRILIMLGIMPHIVTRCFDRMKVS